MTRRHFLVTAGSAASATMINGLAYAENPRNWKGYDAAVVIDALGGPGNANGPRAERTKLTAADLADVKASGLTAVNLTVNAIGSYAKDFEETLTNIAFYDGEIAAHPDVLMKVKSSADLAEAKRAGDSGSFTGFRTERLRRIARSARSLPRSRGADRLVYLQSQKPDRRWLSRAGERGTESFRARLGRAPECEARVDRSQSLRRSHHAGVDRLSKQPVAITHTGCRAVTDLPRNKTDEQLRKLADKGGVVGIYFMPYLRTAASRWRRM